MKKEANTKRTDFKWRICFNENKNGFQERRRKHTSCLFFQQLLLSGAEMLKSCEEEVWYVVHFITFSHSSQLSGQLLLFFLFQTCVSATMFQFEIFLFLKLSHLTCSVRPVHEKKYSLENVPRFSLLENL